MPTSAASPAETAARTIDVCGSERLATNPSSAIPPMAAFARSRRVRASTPTAAPRASATISTATLSASLSFVPNHATTTSLAPAGWSAMTAEPTETTRLGAPSNSAARSSVTASASAAATTPAKAAHDRGTSGPGRTGTPASRAGGVTARAEVLTGPVSDVPMTPA